VLRIWISSYADPDPDPDPDPAVHVHADPDPDTVPTVACSRDDQLKRVFNTKYINLYK
jgi:hypothetical protein